MCKRPNVETYLKVNALQDDARAFVFLETMIVGHFL